MKYMLLMYANEAVTPMAPEEVQAIEKEWHAFMTEANAAGAQYNGPFNR